MTHPTLLRIPHRPSLDLTRVHAAMSQRYDKIFVPVEPGHRRIRIDGALDAFRVMESRLQNAERAPGVLGGMVHENRSNHCGL